MLIGTQLWHYWDFYIWIPEPIRGHFLSSPSVHSLKFLRFFLGGGLFRAAPVAYGSPRLGVESELQLPAYTTAPATQDPSRVCDLHHSSRQCRILHPLSEARGRTRHLRVPSRIRFQLCTFYRWGSSGREAAAHSPSHWENGAAQIQTQVNPISDDALFTTLLLSMPRTEFFLKISVNLQLFWGGIY